MNGSTLKIHFTALKLLEESLYKIKATEAKRQENSNMFPVDIQGMFFPSFNNLGNAYSKVFHQMEHQISSNEMKCQKGFTSFQIS